MASGQTLGIFKAIDGVPTATNGSLPLVTSNNIFVQEFDPSTQQSCDFAWTVPQNYSATTGWTLYLHWIGVTATSGAVLWGAAVERDNAGGSAITTDHFASTVNAGGGAATTAGTTGVETVTSIALTNGTQINSAAVGDDVRVRIYRIAADATDTMSGYAGLVGFEIRET